MRDELGLLARRIDGNRMRELLIDFANIQRANEPAAATADWLAGLLRASGAVESRVYDRDLGGPVVVAGFPGVHRKPTLQFLGYFAPGAGGPRRAFAADGYVHGPTVTSTASGLIAAAEAARVLAEYGALPGGGLLFTAHMASDPADAASDIERLIDLGIAGQAVVITRGPADVVPVLGQGTCRFEVRFTIPEAGAATFECRTSAIDAAHAFCGTVRRRHFAAARAAHESGEPEAVVVGSVGGGDRYDALARSSWLKGVWRFGPGRIVPNVRGELERIAMRVAAACGTQAAVTVEMVRAPYRLEVTGSPVDDLRAAYRAVWGDDLPLGTCSVPCDVPLFLGRGIPAICHGPRPAKVESLGNEECVSVADIVRLAEVYARLSLSFLRQDAASPSSRPVSSEPKEHSGTMVAPVGNRRATQGLTA